MTTMPPRAGIVYKHNEGGVASCVREEERPPTPAAISQWRRSGTSHPAAQEVDPKMSFGSGGVKASDHVTDIWRQVHAAAGNTEPRHTPGTYKHIWLDCTMRYLLVGTAVRTYGPYTRICSPKIHYLPINVSYCCRVLITLICKVVP